MPTQSKAQQAALLRVQQIGTELRETMAKIKFETGAYPNLGSLDHEFDKSIEEVATLVKEHSLDQSVLTEFTTRLVEEIYQKAGSLKCHAWQARFAKNYRV